MCNKLVMASKLDRAIVAEIHRAITALPVPQVYLQLDRFSIHLFSSLRLMDSS